MRILTTVLAGAVMMLSTGAMAQDMGDRMHDGMEHRDHSGGYHSDNRIEHRDARYHRVSHHGRYRHCMWTWRHHHRVKVCTSRWRR